MGIQVPHTHQAQPVTWLPLPGPGPLEEGLGFLSYMEEHVHGGSTLASGGLYSKAVGVLWTPSAALVLLSVQPLVLWQVLVLLSRV